MAAIGFYVGLSLYELKLKLLPNKLFINEELKLKLLPNKLIIHK